MNQNLLIVDDENEILSWLEELFRYEFDMEIGVYTANSAMEALNLLDRVRFDVVLTDIRMPGMDGITLFERIKENWPRCKTVFLTGYRNFEDIYRIINHKDVQYILKSEEDDAITQAVRKFLLLGLQEVEAENLHKEQEYRLEKAKYWMQREFLDQICAGLLQNDLADRTADLKISLNVNKEVLLFFLRIDKHWMSEEIEQRFIQEEGLIQILYKNIPGKLKVHVHIMDKQQLLLFAQPEEGSEQDWETISAVLCGMLEYAQEIFKNTCHNTFSAIIPSEAVGFSGIPAIIRRMKAYMIQYIGGEQELILKECSLKSQTEESKGSFAAGKNSGLLYLLEARKHQEYFTLMGGFLNEMMEKMSRHDTRALEIYYSISILLLQFINENHLNEQLAFKAGIYKLTRVEAHESWLEAAEYLTEISEAIFQLLDTNENTLTQRALNRIVTYIEGHLEEDLSLSKLAEVGGFNPSYLSRLFKQVRGESVSDFILQKRMRLAEKLLAGTNEKIQDIAVKTGYLSAHSFTRAFRSETGISPTEYRGMRYEDKK